MWYHEAVAGSRTKLRMTSATAFLQALRDDPDDQTTLLVFADWLTDQDDPSLTDRGELIRVQTALSRWVPDVEQRESLLQRQQELLQRWASTWLGPVLPFCRSWRFQNGLPSIVVSTKNFLRGTLAEEAEDRLNAAGILSVKLEDCSAGDLVLLANVEHLRLLTRLDLSGNGLDSAAINLLARSPHLAGLTDLDLSNNQIGDRGLLALLTSRHLSRLTRLDLRNNQINKAAGLRRGTARLPQLHQVELHGNELDLIRWVVEGVDPAGPSSPVSRLVNCIGMELALIPAGSFRMGSPEMEQASERPANGPAGADERPQHLVAITTPFYVGVYPVTQRQYEAVMGNNPAEFTFTNRGGPAHPVERVRWEDAQRFCERLSALPQERLAGRVYRLPTEAEWEYACRAGTGSPFWWGETASSRQANFDGAHPYGNAVPGRSLGRTSQVGSYAANPFGLYDMHGNVWEWCQDYYDPHYYVESLPRDPLGPSPRGDNRRRSARGGSWSSFGVDCRSACRDFWYGDNYALNNIGFRVALTVSQQS
jgi:uncharacterized protein (TIGR02996 family)